MSEISTIRDFKGIEPTGRLWTHVLALPAGLAILTGCGKAHQDHTDAQLELPSVQVRTQIVEARQIAAVAEVVGTVRARLRATLEAKASGRITELPIVLGQRVRKGDLLARLEAPEIQARLDQAEAAFQQAERDRTRNSSLLGKQAVSRAEYDAVEARYRVAKGALAEARAMIGYLEILAPFGGVVTKKRADVGDLAAPGKPLLDLEDPAKLQLEADVPETIASKIQQDARLKIRVMQGRADLTGTVAEMSPIADPASRTFRVRLDLPAGCSMRSGQFARLLVPAGEAFSLRVPALAVVQRGQMEIAYVVEKRRACLHLVKTGRRGRDEVEILSGLDSGDAVVVDSPQQLVDGQPVRER